MYTPSWSEKEGKNAGKKMIHDFSTEISPYGLWGPDTAGTGWP